MLAKLIKPCNKGGKGLKDPKDEQKSMNFHEEYQMALKTKSYVDFLNKAHELLINNYFDHIKLSSNTLLEPCQESIPSILDNTTRIFPKRSHQELRSVMLSYFDITYEASNICIHLLKSIKQVQSNYQFIQKALDIIIIVDDDDESLENFNIMISEFNSFIFLSNPFSRLINNNNNNQEYFKHISDKHSLLLQHLKSMITNIGRKIKLINFLLKFLTIIAIGKKLIRRSKFSSSFVRRICDQLDIASKGTYILSRDFETMSRLVVRVHDEIEHIKLIVKFCLERKEDKLFSLQMVMEIIKKNDVVFRKQMDELQEHVCLCLVTINRARCLVFNEITKSCIGLNACMSH
ncbi:hypothetical protein Ahy_A05g021822 [Arachis hypogaea]|uniref:Uncharacterized protein n=1 Tax=Arachis hypogaea TaxID=3818 RepID=A0A445CYQ1_ARAHY|nr:hypothetical protein Ahy_A05g021822 [Arachis hypogaea]